MWIVRLALRRPYTFIVAALLIFLVSPLVILNTPTDVFPDINIPVASVIWNFGGFSPDDIANRITSVYERSLTTTVNDIEHVESQSLQGRAIVKIFFQPGADMGVAMSQLSSISAAYVKWLPAGATPPFIITYNASSVPVLQLGLASTALSEQELTDWALNFIRPQLVTVPGVGIPNPYGGRSPEVNVDIDLAALQSKGLSPIDVVNAISVQNLVLPGGTAKIGGTEYNVIPNGSPGTIEGLANLPIREINGSMVYVRDVAHVRRGFDIQTNVVRNNGVRGVLMTLLKTGRASTIDIVKGVRARLPKIATQIPADIKITTLIDQSLFVRAAINGVVSEGIIAAVLTGLMILLFLGSWRSTLIITISIPLSILCSICALSALGQSINLMTLGGLALAVGMLVDDATVAIENINRHLEEQMPLEAAILEGSRQIAVPALVSTLCICIVFIPMFLLAGVARYLFFPLAEAVVFAMLASYVLSRTLVPTLAMYLLRYDHAHTRAPGSTPAVAAPPGFLRRAQQGFERGFERMRARYEGLLGRILARRRLFAAVFLGLCAASFALVPFLGQDFFPEVDAGQIRLHVRAKSGTRIEEMASLCDRVEDRIREVIPRAELDEVLDNIGLPYSGINISYSNSGTVGPADAEILLSLKPGHGPTASYVRQMRMSLPQSFPGVSFYFQPADIVTQILNFGLPSPVDVQLVGRDVHGNFAVASKMMEEIRRIPGVADAHIQQLFDQPQLRVDIDRTKAEQLGLTEANVATDLLIVLSGTGQVVPTYWLNTDNGVNYGLVTQMPDYRVNSIHTLENIPINSPNGRTHQVLGNLAKFSLGAGAGVVTHYDVTPTIDIYATAQDRDLGGIARDIEKVVTKYTPTLPRGSSVVLRGQVETMRSSFRGLAIGILGAIVLVYLLIVVNFQSWTDPLIIITALPGALAGIVWMLFLTGTTLNVPSLMGSIMCIGVATANSILIISFAKERLEEGSEAEAAAIAAGGTRLRPVLMTALAMIIGMVPMAFGFGEGGEQNAPLARAVIGGLALATVATLFFVPVVFTLVRQRRSGAPPPPALPPG